MSRSAAKIALYADLCYNKALKTFVVAMLETSHDWPHLYRRCDVNTLPLHAQDGNLMKTCSKCKRELPAATEFFARNKTTKDGFQYYCKQCCSIAKPKDPVPDGYKQCSKCKRILPATTDNFGWRGAYKGRKPRFESHCKQCKSQSDHVYMSAHREERKQYRQSRRELDKHYMVAYRQEHSEELKTYDATYKATHREHSNRRHRAYLIRYYQTERGQIQRRVSTANRRARKRNATGKHTLKELRQQYDRQKGRCYYCHEKLDKDRSSWVAEHIVPLSRGGSNSIDNIVVACRTCNLKKGSKMPHEWNDGGRLL